MQLQYNMIVSIIVATDLNNGIGKDNQLLWRLSDDLKIFKKLTSNHHILMGRKTFDSIGKPLPNRINLVLTSKESVALEGCIVISSLDEGIRFAKEAGENELFIIGGGKVYEQALALVDKIYLTKVKTNLVADTFFPKINEAEWDLVELLPFKKNEKNEYDFDFMVLNKKG